jgi:ATP-binding cassette subfamily C protein CydC
MTSGRRWMVMAAGMGFATVASGVGLMATAAFLLSMAALHPSIAELQIAIVGVRFFGIVRGLCRYLERYLAHQVTFRLLARLRVWFYRAVEPLAPGRLMERRSGDLLGRIVSDVETLEHLFTRVLGPVLVATMTVVLLWALLGRLNAGLAAAVCGLLLVAGLGIPILTRAATREPGRRHIAQRARLNAGLVDGVQGLTDLLVFDHGGWHRHQVADASVQMEEEQARLTRRTALGSAATSAAADLTALVALLVAIPLVDGGSIAGVQLAVIVVAVLAAFEAVAPLPLAAGYLEACSAAARRLFEIVDARPDVGVPVAPAPLTPVTSLEVRGLSFWYPGTSRPAVEGLDLELPEGGRVAIVGPSGGGKSTVAHLILRLWDYTTGSIHLGGRELRNCSPDEVRDRFGVVSQRPHLFEGSVRYNLLLARPDATEEQMHEAARRAGAHELVSSLPQGYDTWVGEHGRRLSGGQRQRLALARALLREAPILLLDEPTASLDPAAEAAVLDELLRPDRRRSVLLLTHRLVALERVDAILVLAAGRVVERGTHTELLERQGPYWRMHHLQRGAEAVRSLLSTVP